jgi:hypothetical protein
MGNPSFVRVEPESARERHRDVGVTVRVGGELGGREGLVPLHTFDRRAAVKS